MPKKGHSDSDLVVKSYDMHGITFTFKESGLVGMFSWPILISALLEGAVMFAVSTFVVQMVAAFLLGDKSKTYREFMWENVSYRYEYARFAAHALIGASVFNQLDSDTNGELSQSELHAYMKAVLGKGRNALSDGESWALTNMILATAE